MVLFRKDKLDKKENDFYNDLQVNTFWLLQNWSFEFLRPILPQTVFLSLLCPRQETQGFCLSGSADTEQFASFKFLYPKREHKFRDIETQEPLLGK